MVTETVLHWCTGDEPAPYRFTEVIDALKAAMDRIPIDARADSVIDFEPFYEHGEYYPQVRVTYERPETSAEEALRVIEEASHWRGQLDAAEKRAEYCRAQLTPQVPS